MKTAENKKDKYNQKINSYNNSSRLRQGNSLAFLRTSPGIFTRATSASKMKAITKPKKSFDQTCNIDRPKINIKIEKSPDKILANSQKIDLRNWQSKTNQDSRPKIITSSHSRLLPQGLACSGSKLRIIMERVKEPIQLFTAKKLDIYSRDLLWRQLNHQTPPHPNLHQSINIYSSCDNLDTSSTPKIQVDQHLSAQKNPKIAKNSLTPFKTPINNTYSTQLENPNPPKKSIQISYKNVYDATVGSDSSNRAKPQALSYGGRGALMGSIIQADSEYGVQVSGG